MSAPTSEAAPGVDRVPWRALPCPALPCPGSPCPTSPCLGEVIPFPGRERNDNRLDTRDRIALLAWVDGGAGHGVCRVVVQHCESGEDPAVVGDFAMLYRPGAAWASWSLARSRGRYQVWEMAYGRTLGLFDTLAGALACLCEQVASANGSSTPTRQASRPKQTGTGTPCRAATPTGRRATTR